MFARISALLLLAALAAGCSSAENPNPAPDSAPLSEGRGVGEVVRIQAGKHADLVILNAGYAAGVRPGMQLILSRQGKAIASLVVAEATQDSAAALILDLTPNETVKAGDSAKVKTVVP